MNYTAAGSRVGPPPLGEAGRLALAMARDWLPRRRFAHSVAAAETAVALCQRYGLDPEAGFLAGVAHDLCKDMAPERQFELARRFDGPLPALAFMDPQLPHGPAAAVFLRDDGLVDDPAVLEAIAYHTFGKPGMGPLALVVYSADKIEPGRGEWIADVASAAVRGDYDGHGGLERLTAAVIERSMDHVIRSGRPVAPDTLILYNALTGKNEAP